MGIVGVLEQALETVGKAAEITKPIEAIAPATSATELAKAFGTTADATREFALKVDKPLIETLAGEGQPLLIEPPLGELADIDRQIMDHTGAFQSEVTLLTSAAEHTAPSTTIPNEMPKMGTTRAFDTEHREIPTNVRMKGEKWEDIPAETRRMLEDDPEVIDQATQTPFESATEAPHERASNLRDALKTMKLPADETDFDRLTQLLSTPETDGLLEDLDAISGSELNDPSREALKKLAIHALIKGFGEVAAWTLEQVAEGVDPTLDEKCKKAAKSVRQGTRTLQQLYTGVGKPSLARDFVNYARLRQGKQQISQTGATTEADEVSN